jgi:hypothetical protein
MSRLMWAVFRWPKWSTFTLSKFGQILKSLLQYWIYIFLPSWGKSQFPKGDELQLTSFFPFFQNMSYQSDDLAVPSVRWLGVHPTDIARLGMKAQPFREADFNKLRKLLLRSYITSHAALQDQVPLFQEIRAYAWQVDLENIWCSLSRDKPRMQFQNNNIFHNPLKYFH